MCGSDTVATKLFGTPHGIGGENDMQKIHRASWQQQTMMTTEILIPTIHRLA